MSRPVKDPNEPPTEYELAVLGGLNHTGRHCYGGTAPYAGVQRRRAKNRVAGRSRRTNRGQR